MGVVGFFWSRCIRILRVWFRALTNAQRKALQQSQAIDSRTSPPFLNMGVESSVLIGGQRCRCSRHRRRRLPLLLPHLHLLLHFRQTHRLLHHRIRKCHRLILFPG